MKTYLRHAPNIPFLFLRKWAEGRKIEYPRVVNYTHTHAHNGSMAAGGSAAEAASSGLQRETNLLVTLLDISDAFSESLQLEDVSQQVHKPSQFRDPLEITLVVVLQLSVGQCLDSVTTFLNSYLLLNQANNVGVCLSHQGGRYNSYHRHLHEPFLYRTSKLLL